MTCRLQTPTDRQTYGELWYRCTRGTLVKITSLKQLYIHNGQNDTRAQHMQRSVVTGFDVSYDNPDCDRPIHWGLRKMG